MLSPARLARRLLLARMVPTARRRSACPTQARRTCSLLSTPLFSSFPSSVSRWNRGLASTTEAKEAPAQAAVSEPYIVMVRLLIKENYIDKFIEAAVHDASGSVIEEQGCRRFDVIQDWQAGNVFAFCEIYDRKDDFDIHITMPHFLKFHRVVRPIQIEEPEVAFCRLVHPADGNFDSYKGDTELYSDFGSLYIRHSSYCVKRASLAEFLSLMLAEAHEASANDNCLRFDVYQNLDNPSELYSYEVFTDKASYTEHTTSQSASKRKQRETEVCMKPATTVVGRNIWPPDSWNFSSEK